MKILWVKAGGLVPPDTGGKIRSYNILRELAKEHEVTFFSFYAEHPNDQHSALNQVFRKAVCLPLQLPESKGFGELLSYGRYVFSLRSYSLMKYCLPQVRRELNSLLQRNTFDVILCDFIFAAPVIPWELHCPKVIFTHNVEGIIWKRHYSVARNPLWKALSWREWKTMRRGERTYLSKADHVLTVSETDRDAFLDFLPESKLTIIPTGVDVDYFHPLPGLETPDSIVFTGSMDWLPNEDGIFYFVEQILPRIRQLVPQASLCIVGRKPSEQLKNLAAHETNIELTGRVEDVRPYVARAAVCIVPLRIGGGTRLKIFEAMAMEKAVVSTTVGAEGLPVEHGRNILLADTPDDFARQTVSLLQNSLLRQQLGSAAHRMVIEHYTWASVAKSFADILQRVAELGESPRLAISC